MKRLLLALVCLMCLACVSLASPIFNSTGGATAEGFWVYWPPAPYYELFASFTVTGSSYTVNSVSLDLGNNLCDAACQATFGVSPNDTAELGGAITVSVNAANGAGGIPGTLIADIGTIQDDTIPYDSGGYTLVSLAIAPLALAPGTYWLGLTDSTTVPGVNWGVTNDVSGPGVAAGYSYDAFDGLLANSEYGAYQMDISGTTTPEPATSALGLIGIAALVFYRRRRSLVS